MLRRHPTQIQLTAEDLHEYEDLKEQQRAASASQANQDQNTGPSGDSPSARKRQGRTKQERLGIQSR